MADAEMKKKKLATKAANIVSENYKQETNPSSYKQKVKIVHNI